MAALGNLKPLFRRLLDGRAACYVRFLNVQKLQNVQAIVVRQMSSSHKRVIDIKPSNYEWKRWTDHFHFYFWLGFAPSCFVIGLVNLFVGPAELVDIPEGYEPKHWEYYKHPITRFHIRYFQDSPEKIYERHLHYLNLEQEKIALRKLRKKVEFLAGDVTGRFDSSWWYYQPAETKVVPHNRETMAEDRRIEGTTGFDLKW